MKKTVLVILFAVMATGTVMAQGRKQPLERIHAAKMAYITDRLRLNGQQAASFVPVYKDYEQEVKTLRQSYFKKYKGTKAFDRDDATSRQYIDDDLNYQQQVIELKRRYNDQFLKFISAQQLSELYKAEREFKQKLLKKLDDCGSPRRRR